MPRALTVAACLVAAALPAQAAFVVDQVQVRREGDAAVLALQFATEVQFQRQIATAAGDTVLIVYQLVSTTNREIGPGSQLLALDHLKGLDRLRLTDEPGQADRERRIVLRLGEPGTVRVRQGADNRAIEILLPGRGERLAGAASAPPARPAPVASAAASGDSEVQAKALLDNATQAMAAGSHRLALDGLNALLDLPPNASTRPAQAMAGDAWLALGDTRRARAEYETFLRLYPQGEDSDRVRQRLATMPAEAAKPETPTTVAEPERRDDTTLDASVALNWYGGNGQLRSQDFQDSPIAGLPPTVGEAQFTSDRASQVVGAADLSWRRRTDDQDQRVVFRNAYTRDLERPEKSRNRLSAAYVDHRALKAGWGVRLGRQSPTGGGVMGRFDGVQGYVTPIGKLRLGAVAGVPAEQLFDTQRHFYGLRLEQDRVVGALGGSLYAIEQRIDGEVDRRAVGLDLRWFSGGTSVFSQFDYDVAFGATNAVSVQGTHVAEDNTVYTLLYDRRALAPLSLGNALTFEDPAQPGVIFTRIAPRLANTTVAVLREQIVALTPMVTQAQAGVTRPLSPHWTVGASLGLTNTGAIPPVPDVPGFETGRPATGDIVSATAQLIGLNLLSDRDTHVGVITTIRSPQLDGLLLAYNQSAWWWSDWQVEPSLQYYRDRTPEGSRSERWTPGLRVTYRGWKKVALETALTYEIGSATRVLTDPSGNMPPTSTRESSRRASYALGARVEF
ncbi:outer membrane protein assembly factor BamD [Rubrivivax albus]|uniref:Outer membrane protein assembly factor BamD n=2 Tax=Rubrivivax albus TaxID=2499835 RepID=A0A437JQ43_9BURK|nr:outer membrane protein assembly factor BamD [Rubrivivax albus]